MVHLRRSTSTTSPSAPSQSRLPSPCSAWVCRPWQSAAAAAPDRIVRAASSANNLNPSVPRFFRGIFSLVQEKGRKTRNRRLFHGRGNRCLSLISVPDFTSNRLASAKQQHGADGQAGQRRGFGDRFRRAWADDRGEVVQSEDLVVRGNGGGGDVVGINGEGLA